MRKSIKQFKGHGHTLNVEQTDDVDIPDGQIEIWFEDFCILGFGETVAGALANAREWLREIDALVVESLKGEHQ